MAIRALRARARPAAASSAVRSSSLGRSAVSSRSTVSRWGARRRPRSSWPIASTLMRARSASFFLREFRDDAQLPQERSEFRRGGRASVHAVRFARSIGPSRLFDRVTDRVVPGAGGCPRAMIGRAKHSIKIARDPRTLKENVKWH